MGQTTQNEVDAKFEKALPHEVVTRLSKMVDEQISDADEARKYLKSEFLFTEAEVRYMSNVVVLKVAKELCLGTHALSTAIRMIPIQQPKKV